MRNIIFLLFIIIYISVDAQQTDYNTIILPASAADVEFSEKLVRLAWQNNPSVGVLHSELNQATFEVRYTKWSWLDNLRITGNLNEFNINQGNNTIEGSQFFPRYNLSASLSLGTLFANPIKTKIVKQNVNISKENINLKKLEIRSKVLSKYQTYLGNKEIYDLRTQMQEDSYSDYKLKEQGFSRGETSLADYTFTLDRYNQQKILKIQAEKDMKISIIELEELIGVKLSDVR